MVLVHNGDYCDRQTHLFGEQVTICPVLRFHVQVCAGEHRGGAATSRPACTRVCEAGT